MHRFYSSFPLGENLILKDEKNLHQILHVFRAKLWNRFIFFEAFGDDLVYEIISIKRNEINLRLMDTIQKKSQIVTHVKLFQALPKKFSILENIVQKIVEIGISDIVIFTSEYSQLQDISENKLERLRMISQEALEQSGNNTPLNISFDSCNTDVLYQRYLNLYNIVWFPWVPNTLWTIKNNNIWLWIWPEWWWSPQEELFFRKNNAVFWSFNANILRLETAAITWLGILSYLIQT